jgi:hypothetical protein
MFLDVDSPPKYKAWIQDHEVWMDSSAGPRRVICDALAADPVAASPSGDRVAYTVPDGKPVPDGLRPSMLVVIVDVDGRSLAKFTAEENSVFDVIEWIDNNRIGVWYCGHANCVYWVVDPNSGRTLHKFFGGFDFLWSHDRRYVARRGLGPVRIAGKDGMIETDDLSSLMLNEDSKDVYPPLNPNTHRRMIASLAICPGLPTTSGSPFRKRNIPAETDMLCWSAHKETYCARACRWMSNTTPRSNGPTTTTSRSQRRSRHSSLWWMVASCTKSCSSRSEIPLRRRRGRATCSKLETRNLPCFTLTTGH